MEHVGKMDGLKIIAHNLTLNKKNLIEDIKNAMRSLGSVE
jgi:hypothetical protein